MHGTLSGDYLGARGEHKGKDRSKVAEREKETYWNCFLTKFFLASKSQAPIFFNYMSTPLKKENPFFVKMVKKKIGQNESGLEKINWFENINWIKIFGFTTKSEAQQLQKNYE